MKPAAQRRRRCKASYDALIGPEAQTTQARAPIVCPLCDRTLRALRHWGDGSVARYPAHYPRSNVNE